MAKTVLVTGASRGIGASVATLAGRAGYTVCVNYRERADKAAEVVARIEAAGGRAAAFHADVSVEKDVVRMFDEVDPRVGPVRSQDDNPGVMIADKAVDMHAARPNPSWANRRPRCVLTLRGA